MAEELDLTQMMKKSLRMMENTHVEIEEVADRGRLREVVAKADQVETLGDEAQLYEKPLSTKIQRMEKTNLETKNKHQMKMEKQQLIIQRYNNLLTRQ